MWERERLRVTRRGFSFVWRGVEHHFWWKLRLGHRRHYSQPYQPPKVVQK